MSEEILIRHCSPTLAGMKTGSVFSCRYPSFDALRDYIRLLNHRLSCKGLRVLPLKIGEATALVYVYRPARLKIDLSDERTASLLRRYGYITTKPEHCIVQLICRLREQKDFPHEIGLFLGYPPEDVCGFIENGARGYKCVGHWKVYGDAEKAELLFDKYRKCTESYLRKHKKGFSIERLTVAV